MEEYNPDSPQAQSNPSGIDMNNVRKIPLNDSRPYSDENPRYPDKFKKHKELGIAMYICPQCRNFGCHKATELDQPKTGYRIGGEVCDICGYEDTYEMGY